MVVHASGSVLLLLYSLLYDVNANTAPTPISRRRAARDDGAELRDLALRVKENVRPRWASERKPAMSKMTPEAEAREALISGTARSALSMGAQLEYDRLRAVMEQEGTLPESSSPSSVPRFPSSSETRQQILEAIARRNDKYARPFDGGRMAFISLIGTESWSDYGGVVLQMAILDTLLSIEEKLDRLTLAMPADAAD